MWRNKCCFSLAQISTDEVSRNTLLFVFWIGNSSRGPCFFQFQHPRHVSGKDPYDSSLYCQRYFSEQIYISLPKDHPLANQKTLSADDLKGLSILTYDVGFWVGLCRQKMLRTSFLIQTDSDTMEQLVIASSLPVFNSDRMLADGYVPPDSVSLKLDEPFAQADYYISCLDSEKSRYGAFFNAIRAELIHASWYYTGFKQWAKMSGHIHLFFWYWKNWRHQVHWPWQVYPCYCQIRDRGDERDYPLWLLSTLSWCFRLYSYFKLVIFRWNRFRFICQIFSSDASLCYGYDS